LLLLVRDGLARALAGAGVGLGALAANGQALAVTQAAIAADIDEALDVDRGLGAQVALDLVAGLDRAAQLADLLVGQVAGLLGAVDPGLLEDGDGAHAADAVDVGQSDVAPLVVRNVDAGNA